MTVLSLFTGGGLGDYGLELAGMETVGQCEKDEYCQKLLKLRWPNVPKWRDIRDVTGEEVRQKCGTIDVVAGGFPCQPFSVAGQQRGTKDDRHLWPEMLRVIREVAPSWVIAENVPGIIRLALDDVLADLEAEGYATLTLVFPAHALGAPHRRDRLWIVAHSERNQHRQPQRGIDEEAGGLAEANGTQFNPAWQLGRAGTDGLSGERHAALADTPDAGAQGVRRRQNATNTTWWSVEPGMDRVVDGCPNRVDRLRVLGNGQVVQAAQWIGEGILQTDGAR